MQDLFVSLANESPLQIVGVIHPLSALQAKQAGFTAIYLSGAGIATANLGLPDLGVTNLNDVLAAIRPITNRVDLPLLVDIDTGWGSPINVARAVKEIENAGASAVHLEDQMPAKRCGHRENKPLVTQSTMCHRIETACAARQSDTFRIMARTDALASEGLEASIARAKAYVGAGADAIFVEAAEDLNVYEAFKSATQVPILANMTEFGKTPLQTTSTLASVGVDMVLYPLSAFRAMNLAAETVYSTLRKDGTQAALLDSMQTRAALYELLDYHHYEKLMDEYLAERTGESNE